MPPNIPWYIAVPALLVGSIAGWWLRYLLTGRRR